MGGEVQVSVGSSGAKNLSAPDEGPVNKDRYVNGKLKTWKEKITTNFHGMSVPHEERCEATAILKIESVYNQGKNFYPQAYFEECKYIENNTQTCTLLSDSEDEGLVAL